MKVIVTGGGTGGHIYPALALIKEIKQSYPQAEFLYIGSEKGMEKGIVQKEGIPFVSIDIAGFKRKLTLENVKTIIKFWRSEQKSRRYIKKFNPDIVIGTGGFVCGPVLYAASKEKIPTIIHEQNVIPGLTNRFLTRYVDVVAVSFEGSTKYFQKAKKLVVTGNPRATEVIQANKFNGFNQLKVSSDKKIVLIFGGSRGAKAINHAFLEMLPKLNQFKEFHFIFVTGDVHYQDIEDKVKNYNEYLPENVSIFPYLYNMPEILAITDLNVSRAGASTLAEVTALGIPSILIPSPYVTNNHQELNAGWLEKQGAAKMIREKDLTGEILLTAIIDMMKEREEYAAAAKNIGKPNAAALLLNEINMLLKK